VQWLTAFVDLTAPAADEARRFWAGVTGYAVSPPRGAEQEFVTLVPPDGDPYLKVQRLADGPHRLHLDLPAVDPEEAAGRAEGLGATVTHRSEHGYVVLASPGGMVFCLVPEGGRVRPAPADRGGFTSAVDQVCLDVPPAAYLRETEFWTALTGWAFVAHAESEFDSLARPAASPIRILFQLLDDEQERVTAHLDLATTDRVAEVARHEALGARVTSVHDQWTVMEPPAGRPYCITDRTP
jgi:hypothetical protein